MRTSNITTRWVDPSAERATVLRLLKAHLPEAATEGRFEWAYLDNPFGTAMVCILESVNGEVVGTSAAFPRQFSMAGKTVTALVLSDFAIVPRYRTLGPAMSLLRATLAAVDDGKFEFAIDHPSESMAAVYKRLGGRELGRQTRYVRLLNVSRALSRRWGAGPMSSVVGYFGDLAVNITDRFQSIPGGLDVSVHPGREFAVEFTKLGSELLDRHKVYGARDHNYLNWRYRNGIRSKNSVVTVRSGGELAAYAVLQAAGTKSMTIVEFICPEDSRIERALLRGLLDHARGSDCDALQASCVDGNPWSKTLQCLGFAAREKSAGPVVYAAKGSSVKDVVEDCTQWWITDGDRDG